jgi:hypothetical protein
MARRPKKAVVMSFDLLLCGDLFRFGVNVSISGLDSFSVWPVHGCTAASSLHGATILGVDSSRPVSCLDGSAILGVDTSYAITLVGVGVGPDRQCGYAAKRQECSYNL